MIIPNYEVSEELSGNDWCVVLRGRRVPDQRDILLKTTRRSPQSKADLELLQREAEMLQELSIPGVTRLVEFISSPQPAFLVVEDHGGVPLRALVAPRSGDMGFFFKVAIQLSSILSDLHQLRIIHRNLNPESVMVNSQTGEVQLSDFSFASGPVREADSSMGYQSSRLALSYISPEQTGRMNRTTDYRTDFYSLGAILYELLSGQRPFASNDPLEIIHGHIAKAPRPPAELDPRVPAIVSEIVMKLLAKNAEHRYQSGLGLKQDLETCASQWAARGRVDGFQIGQHDVPDYFVISQQLYGREPEAGELLAEFDDVCGGRSSMMLVSGGAGIGKTSLIHELYRPIVRKRGYFISGKFDQVARSVPFSALIQAFRGLVRQLLAESEARLALWRANLSAAMGANGGVLADVIPEIELIVGKQPPPPAMGPTEALNRFQLVIQNFAGALARVEHPLVVFLDDLQWADSATLSLLQPLLTTPDISCLFLIGAYRDNEVDCVHPLTRTLTALETAGANLRSVSLGPLQLEDLAHLIDDVLHGGLADAIPLARLILRKTAGNPFFVTQFLKTLKQKGFLSFDYAQGRWAYSIDEIGRAAMTDNVIELMTHKIQQLSARTQRAMTLASCIGSPFDQQTLAIVSEQTLEETAEDLREALNEGLILTSASPYNEPGQRGSRDSESAVPGYSFLHDRVQQAAYALIPAEQKQIVHLRVGRLLFKSLESEVGEERLFDVVHHLNLGGSLIADAGERLTLARLNMSAGHKAKASTAYGSALDHFKSGCALLTEEDWRANYDLCFDLHLQAAECRNLCADFEQADRALEALLLRAETSFDRARVHLLRAIQYENLSRYADVLASGREALALFGVSFPDTEDEKLAALDIEIESIQNLLDGRSIDSLIDLAVMIDPGIRMVMNALTTIWSGAYISGDQVLTRLISATMVRLSLIHGNSEESAYGYATHTVTVGPIRGDYQSAYDFGELALHLNERFKDSKRRAKIYQQFHAHANLWSRPFATCLPYAREASRSGFESGDFTYGVYGAFTETWVEIVITQDLAQFVQDYSPNVALFKKLKVASVGDAQTALVNWARALRGQTNSPTDLSDGEFDENRYVETYRDNSFFLICYAVAKLQLCYLFGQYAKALEAARTGRAIVHNLEGTIWPVIFEFWNGLTLAANWAGASDADQESWLAELKTAKRWFDVLSESCAENFRCQSLFLSAEIERIEGRPLATLELYEQALGYARQIKMIQYEALADELLAKFWLGRGHRTIAATFVSEAESCYSRWGATAKAGSLRTEFQDLLGSCLVKVFKTDEGGEGEAHSAAGENLDVATAVKAAQALAQEIDLEKLLARLMSVAIENAGAQRGSFLLEDAHGSWVWAEGARDTVEVNISAPVPLDQASGLSPGIVNYVRRTLESVVLADAREDDRYVADEYISREQPRSILCTPVLQQNRLIGVLYLENNLVSDAFTTERIKLMQLISSEAAISIENARLYDETRQEVARRGRAEEELRAALAELEVLKDRLQAENVYLQEEIRREHNFDEIVGNSPALLSVLADVERVAPTDSTVLINGETGTGKELIARAVHNRSARRGHPLVKVNCGAISAGLVESELFGHVKGAFTGAFDKRVGRFELADGGTLFLDELSELPLDTQVKLLRVLQEGEFEPVGSSRTVRVRVRVIAATNRNLAEEVRAGRFRPDLFYRLNVFPIRVPSLRERFSDVPQLVAFFLSRFAKKFGKKIDAVSQETMEMLRSYQWPGNIRELQNIIERGVVLAQGPVLSLDRELLQPASPQGRAASATTPFRAAGSLAPGDVASPPASPDGSALSSPPSLEEMERRHILSILSQAGWVIEGSKGAARLLNLHPNTLRSRMKKLGIRRPTHENQ